MDFSTFLAVSNTPNIKLVADTRVAICRNIFSITQLLCSLFFQQRTQVVMHNGFIKILFFLSQASPFFVNYHNNQDHLPFLPPIIYVGFYEVKHPQFSSDVVRINFETSSITLAATMFRYYPLDAFTWILQNLVCTACNFNKKTLQHSYFPANFSKVLRVPFLQINTSG